MCTGLLIHEGLLNHRLEENESPKRERASAKRIQNRTRIALPPAATADMLYKRHNIEDHINGFLFSALASMDRHCLVSNTTTKGNDGPKMDFSPGHGFFPHAHTHRTCWICAYTFALLLLLGIVSLHRLFFV